jgi:hypothetical protein
MYVADTVIGTCAPEVRERFQLLCFEQCEEVSGFFLNLNLRLVLKTELQGVVVPWCASEKRRALHVLI